MNVASYLIDITTAKWMKMLNSNSIQKIWQIISAGHLQGGHLGYTEIQAVVFMYAMSAHQAGYMANILSNISDTASCGQSIISAV